MSENSRVDKYQKIKAREIPGKKKVRKMAEKRTK